MTGSLQIAPPLAEALAKRGYEDLTPVQKAVLAPELGEADLLVSAQTGSGKTVAFGLALASTLLEGESKFGRAQAPMALAIAPTRELALQVKRELEWLYAETGAIVASCVGGMDMRTERRALSMGAHIVVGTPGRLKDHIERGSFDTSALRAVVLDEADEMLDLGFREDLEFILGSAPQDRRTLMFSATVPRTIATLAKTFQRDAVRVTTVAEASQHLDIEYRALTCSPSDQENAVINVLRYFDAKNALVFCGTRAAVNHLTARFSNRGMSVVALSGELSQKERSHALQSMRDGRAKVCIATDVAARGIDLPNLELVIHADMPRNRESLLHRSGRTGRAGRKGVSALIVPWNARRRTERLLQSAGIDAEWSSPPTAEDVLARDDERLMQHPAFEAEVDEGERATVDALLAGRTPEQLAAAFVRINREGRAAPEELAEDTGQRTEAPRTVGPRNDFTNGVWVSLSIGRRERAEPRWILPTMCKAGDLTKRDIGAIRIEETETNVEIAGDAVDRFMAALGPDAILDKNITVRRLNGAPPKGTRRGPVDDGPRPAYKPRPAGADSARRAPYKGARRDD
jgi:ATP-dependent RNA helicase DeaD